MIQIFIHLIILQFLTFITQHQQQKQHMSSTVVYQCKKGHLDIMRLVNKFDFTIEMCTNILSHIKNQKQCTLQNELGKNKHFLRYLHFLKNFFQNKKNPIKVEIDTMLKNLIEVRKQNSNQGKFFYLSNLHINMTSIIKNKSIEDISQNKINLPYCHLNLLKIYKETNQQLRKQDEHEFLRVFCAMVNQGGGVIHSSRIQEPQIDIERLKKTIKQLYEPQTAKITPRINWQECVTLQFLQKQRIIKIQISFNYEKRIKESHNGYENKDKNKTYFVCSEGKKNFHSYIFTNHGEIIFLPMEKMENYMFKKFYNIYQIDTSVYLQYQKSQVQKKFPKSSHLDDKNWMVWLIYGHSEINEEIEEHLMNELKIERGKDCIKRISQCYSEKVAQNLKQMAFLYLKFGQNTNNIPNYREFNFKNKDQHTVSYNIDLISSSFEIQDNERTKQALEWAKIRCGEEWGKKPIYRQSSQRRTKLWKVLRFQKIQQCVYTLINFNRKKKVKVPEIKFRHEN